MDALSELLKWLHLKSAVYFQSDFPSTWGMDVPQARVSQFHMIVKGECLLESNRGKMVLEEGDIVVFPFGTAHRLYAQDGNMILPGIEVVQSLGKGEHPFDGLDTGTSIICGHFEIDLAVDHPFMKSLPGLIHLKKEMQEPWLLSVAQGIISETAARNPGASLIAANLAEVLFVHVLRTYVSTQSPETGFLAALFDERIGKSLQLMHTEPESARSLKDLANHCGMSRTLFANRFRDLVGIPPAQYLTDLRMMIAGQLLLEEGLPILEVAERVGYGSEAAFIRSFKKKYNVTPGQYRSSA